GAILVVTWRASALDCSFRRAKHAPRARAERPANLAVAGIALQELRQPGVTTMCDFSLQHVRARPAEVGDRLVTRDFGTGTRGFACQRDLGVAVCLLPGTELAFDKPVGGPEPLLVHLLRRLVGKPAPAPAYCTA